MRPNYVARKSSVAPNAWLIPLFILIIPVFIFIVKVVIARHYVIEFYNDKIVVKSGVLNTQERQSVFMGVYSVSISQSLWGRMCGYGNISVDCPGRWDIDTECIENPQALKHYLETKITAKGVTNVVYN